MKRFVAAGVLATALLASPAGAISPSPVKAAECARKIASVIDREYSGDDVSGSVASMSPRCLRIGAKAEHWQARLLDEGMSYQEAAKVTATRLIALVARRYHVSLAELAAAING